MQTEAGKVIGVVTQRDPAVDDPVESDLFRIGTLTHVRKRQLEAAP